MSVEPRESGEGKKPEGPQISLALRAFIVINIILLAGGAAWWAKGFVEQSAAQAKLDAADDARKMADMIAGNPAPRDPAQPAAGLVKYVLDASAREKWIHFSFARSAAFSADQLASDSAEWDIAFRRAKILTNGGATGKAGKAEVAALMGVKYGEVASAPADGYYKDMPTDNIQENVNPALDKWYDYDFLTHKLRVKDAVVYVMKTAKGETVKFQLLNYYCGGVSGCYTIQYEFLPQAAK